VRATVQKSVGQTAFSSWIAPLRFDKIDLGTLYISSPTRFIADWVRRNFSNHIIDAAREFGVNEISIAVHVESAPAKIVSAEIERASASSAPAAEAGTRLGAQYSFSNFIEAPSNRLALASIQRALTGASFNPLFIHSASGMGKTHLLQAYANEMGERARLIYASADQFLYSYVKACKEHDNVRFRESYLGADALLIDDIQFIVGKEATARELLSVIESYISSGRQVIIASSQSPYQMDGLDAGIKSRIASGLVVDIQNAEYDLRLEIVRRAADGFGMLMPAGVAEFVAGKVASSIRELKGAVNRLSAHSVLMNEVLSVASARRILSDVLASESKPIEVANIKKIVAEKWGVSVADMDSEKKSRQFVVPRQVAMFIAKNLTQKSLPVLGKMFGGRDHATVIHACKKVRDMMIADARLSQLVEDVERECASA
jgi:chromosomal replication initiator protein